MALDQYRQKSMRRGDPAILLLVIGLSLFGLLMISSASVVVSYETFGSNTVFLTKQALYFVLSLVVLIVASLIDYRIWKHYAFYIFMAAIVLMLAVEVVGVSLGGARRWINLGPVLLQPSEIMKLSFIIYAAAWLDKKGKAIESLKEGLLPFGLILGFVSLIIISQPDLGTTLVVIATAVTMLFVAGVPLVYFTLGGVGGIFLIYLLIRTSAYRWERFLTFLNPKADIQGAGYQINQALLAIGSGGWLGLGFGQSRQKYLYLPQAQTDAIFAIMVEELGFLRVLFVILAFLWLGFKGITVAKKIDDPFGKFLATGITTWILFQAFVNMGGIMGVIPLTGIPLPFISYGGSSLLALSGAAGILYNISRHTQGNR